MIHPESLPWWAVMLGMVAALELFTRVLGPRLSRKRNEKGNEK